MELSALVPEDPLSGPAHAETTFRPERIARTIDSTDIESFRRAVHHECQFWSGAVTALVPVYGEARTVPAPYREALATGDIDGFRGFDHPVGNTAKTVIVETAESPMVDPEYGRPLAFEVSEYHQQDRFAAIDSPRLEVDDPYYDIYVAMLGELTDGIHVPTARAAHFSTDVTVKDFFHIEKPLVAGSINDVVSRATASFTPRKYSMYRIPYGARGSSHIRTPLTLPDPEFARIDAGPNVLVVCTPRNVEDHALLWNLRAKFGDHQAVPLGVPLGDFDRSTLQQIEQRGWLDNNGFASTGLYVTSTSVDLSRIRAVVEEFDPTGSRATTIDPKSLLDLRCYYGWQQSLTLFFEDGRADIPDMRSIHSDMLGRIDRRAAPRFRLDMSIRKYPIPHAKGVKLRGFQSWIGDGKYSTPVALRGHLSQGIHLPSLLSIHQLMLAECGLKMRPSQPGRDVAVLLGGMRSIHDVMFLCDDRLLTFLEENAAARGFNWIKKRAQAAAGPGAGKEMRPFPSLVAPDVDSLRQFTMPKLQRSLRSAPASRSWLEWAEISGLVVRGFDLECGACGSRFWTAVRAFSIPEHCPGCSTAIHQPFPSAESIVFSYRISERLRKVYESDSLGHVLVMRYFASLFSEGFFGAFPGVEFVDTDGRVTSEVDVLAALGHGYVPIEVKRSEGGIDETQVGRLDQVGEQLGSRFTAIAVMKYASDIDESFWKWEDRTSDRHRVLLTLDELLNPHPMWALGADPFERPIFAEEQLVQRREEFTRRTREFRARGAEPFDPGLFQFRR